MIVDEDASNTRLLHDFLHNCSEGRFATSLSILFGNCVEKIAENDRHQTYSRLTSNKIFVLYEIPFLLGQKEKESHRLNYLKDNLLVNTKVPNGRKILFLDPLILLPRLLRIFRRPEVNLVRALELERPFDLSKLVANWTSLPKH